MMGEHDGEHKDGGGIKVVDKRRFTASGEARTGAPTEDPKKPPAPPPRETKGAAGARRPGAGNQGSDFLSFIASLATNAMASLGLVPEAQARGMPVNPQMAREYIEIIAMLQERTQGNLTPEEDQALVRLINELRMQFVEVTQGPGVPGAPPGTPGAAAAMPGLPGGMRGVPGGPGLGRR